MNKKILVFTDLDGTLLDHYTYQTDDAQEMIDKLKQDNIAIIPNSSKTFPEIELIRQQLSLHSPFITENGAAIYIPVNYFEQQPSDTRLEGQYWVKSFSHSSEHWQSLLKEFAGDFANFYQGFSEMSVSELMALTDLSEDNAKMAKQRQYSEPLHWTGDQATQTKFVACMEKQGANVLQGGRFLHISGHCNKGQAQQWLAQQYSQYAALSSQSEKALIAPHDEIITIALGDGKNDIAMLEQATIAVQIKSPVHDFPSLERNNNIYQSRQYGPAGWAECLQEILSSTLIC
ncbi:HAD-IIB family hydrolase [Psychromonas sp. KJ10-2]|uniref:HAD-IIB family hydrolase n=1 Tax=Psychromonas sp. KJ10-2 TaxID=3391822 RepID=UPI0039B5815C